MSRMPRTGRVATWITGVLMLAACSATDESGTGTSDDTQADAGGLPDSEALPGKQLTLTVPADERVYVRLDTPAIVADETGDSDTWDIAFEGWNIFTNSGPSGPGNGGSFGPNDDLDFLFDEVPAVPFMRPDSTGGAFYDWYDYDGKTHSLWSRYHIYGVRSGEDLFKVQILGYYGEEFGAPVSALYRLRYARVTADGSSTFREIESLDATAGGPDISDDTPSGCLNLKTGDVSPLTPSEARASEDWDLCFRRESVSINGDEGGPGAVSAVDLQADRTTSETFETVQQRTSDSERASFDAADYSALTDDELEYEGDRIVSLFRDRWYEGKGEDAKPTKTSWLVRSADGAKYYMLVFLTIEGDARSAGKIALQVRPLEEQ